VSSLKRENDNSLRGKGEKYRNIAVEQRRSMKLRDNERSLIELVRSLDTKYDGLIVVVEGKRDTKVLRDLGLKAPIVRTQSKLPRYRMIEQIATKAGTNGQVLILTDFDQEGTETCNLIEQGLQPTGVKTLKGVRVKIRKLMGNWRCIEEMVSLFKRRDSPERATI
jgi:5S rRNA maturation endonuclease (ribonuclease M5)